jgi:transposase
VHTAVRLRVLYLPSYGPWPRPIEMLWRTIYELFSYHHTNSFPTIKALVGAAYGFFERYNRPLGDVPLTSPGAP